VITGEILCFGWWCLSLWPCLSWFFVLIVGVLWVFDLQWHQLPRWVHLLYLPPPCYHPFFGKFQWRTSRWKVKPTPTSTSKCDLHHQFLHGSKYKKWRPHSHLHNLTLLTVTRTKMKIKAWSFNMPHAKMSNSAIKILFVSLILVSSLSESRDEIMFKGGRFVTPWNFLISGCY
jgi:hypothetical protein